MASLRGKSASDEGTPRMSEKSTPNNHNSEYRLPAFEIPGLFSSDTESPFTRTARHLARQNRALSLGDDSRWDDDDDDGDPSVTALPAIYSGNSSSGHSRPRQPSAVGLLEHPAHRDSKSIQVSSVEIAHHRESSASHTAPLLPPTPSDAEKTALVSTKTTSLGNDPSDDDDDDGDLPELHRVEPLNISLFHEILFIGVVIMAQFLALAGLGQSIAPMAIIAEDLNVPGNPGQQAWFAAAYSLTVGTFILISGRIGDIMGHKRIFIFGFFFLGTWSAFAGFSAYTHRPVFFDVCRGFQGIGAALLAPNALALLGRAYPPGIKKNIVFSLFGAMAPWGFVLGALFASLFAQYSWWPWAFFSYAIAAWLLAAFSLLVIPKSLAHDAQLAGSPSSSSSSGKVHFDYTGSVLGVTGLVLVNIAFNNGPLYGWGTAHVYLVLIFGVLALVAFGWVETRAISPILPVKAMTSTVTYTMALVGIGWGSFGIWIYYSFRFLLELRGESPLAVSIEYLPAMICGLLAAGVTGFMLTHTPVAFTMMIAMVAFFLGQLITATQPVGQTYWAQMFVAILIMPFGMDMSFPAATIILSNHMPREHQGLAASLVNTMVNYSISIALGIAGTVEVAVNRKGADATPDDVMMGIRCAWWSGVVLAAVGVILGAMFFGRKFLAEGWKVMEH